MTVELWQEEAAVLEEILDHSLRELRVEVRRTSTPVDHDDLERREKRVRELLARLRATQTA